MSDRKSRPKAGGAGGGAGGASALNDVISWLEEKHPVAPGTGRCVELEQKHVAVVAAAGANSENGDISDSTFWKLHILEKYQLIVSAWKPISEINNKLGNTLLMSLLTKTQLNSRFYKTYFLYQNNPSGIGKACSIAILVDSMQAVVFHYKKIQTLPEFPKASSTEQEMKNAFQKIEQSVKPYAGVPVLSSIMRKLNYQTQTAFVTYLKTQFKVFVEKANNILLATFAYLFSITLRPEDCWVMISSTDQRDLLFLCGEQFAYAPEEEQLPIYRPLFYSDSWNSRADFLLKYIADLKENKHFKIWKQNLMSRDFTKVPFFTSSSFNVLVCNLFELALTELKTDSHIKVAQIVNYLFIPGARALPTIDMPIFVSILDKFLSADSLLWIVMAVVIAYARRFIATAGRGQEQISASQNRILVEKGFFLKVKERQGDILDFASLTEAIGKSF